MAKAKRKVSKADMVELELRLPRATWNVYYAASKATGHSISDLIVMSLAVSLAAIKSGN